MKNTHIKKFNEFIKVNEYFYFEEHFSYNKDTKDITISYLNYGTEGRNYDALFDYLGDYDVITASELGEDIIICSNNIYKFTKQDEIILQKDGQVTLQCVGNIEDYKNTNPKFYTWYHNQ